MSSSKLFLVMVSLFIFLTQPSFAARMYDVNDLSACVPVGKIAIKMIDLKKIGYEREFIETSLKSHLDRELVLWVRPIARLVFSEPEKSSEKVIKQAIASCLRTLNKHKNRHNKSREALYV